MSTCVRSSTYNVSVLIGKNDVVSLTFYLFFPRLVIKLVAKSDKMHKSSILKLFHNIFNKFNNK